MIGIERGLPGSRGHLAPGSLLRDEDRRRSVVPGLLALFVLGLLAVLGAFLTAVPALGQASPEGTPVTEGPASTSRSTGNPSALPELARDILVDIAAPAVASPGNSLRVIYTVSNAEAADERVRLLLVLPDGWAALDPVDGEWILASGEDLEGDVHVVASRDAAIGSIASLLLRVTVPGEAGAVEAVALVRVARSGGLPPGHYGLAGTAQVVQRSVELDRPGVGPTDLQVELAGRLDANTTASVSVQRGGRLDQAPVLTDYGAAETRFQFDLRRSPLALTAGNRVYATSDPLAGPFARVEGMKLRSTGRLKGELTAGVPVSFADDASGSLVRGHVGAEGETFGARVSFSTLGRPTYGPLDGSSFGQRVDAGALELTLAPGTGHRLAVRGGLLSQSDDTRRRHDGAVAEGGYTLTGRKTTVTLRGRWMPPSLPGLYLAADEAGFYVSRSLFGTLRMTGQGSQSSTATVGRESPWTVRTVTVGLEHVTPARRVQGRSTLRRVSTPVGSSIQEIEQRTVGGLYGMPVGPLNLDLSADVGRQRSNGVDTPLANGHVALRWLGRSGSSLLTITHSNPGIGTSAVRAALSASVRTAEVEVDGGAWVARGPNYGGTPGLWANAAVPVRGSFEAIGGVEWVRGRIGYVQYVDPVTGAPLPPEIGSDLSAPRVVGVPVAVTPTPFRVTLGVRTRLLLPLGQVR